MTRAQDTDALAVATKRMGLVTALLTVVLGLNTLVSTCSSERSQRDALVRERIAAEEQYWIAASRELGEIAGQKADEPDGAWRIRHKLLRDRALTHPAPFGDDRSDLSEEQGKAVDNVESLREQVEQALSDQALFGEQAKTAQTVIFQRDQIIGNLAKQPALTAAQREVAEAAAGAIATRANAISLTPESDDGWDIDVFWCARSDPSAADANFDQALRAGRALAALVQGGQNVGGEKLGRIRVKVLPINLQARDGTPYPSAGRTLRYDSPREDGFARALAALPALSGFRLDPTRGYSSRFYLSLFACEAGALAPARAVGRPAAIATRRPAG